VGVLGIALLASTRAWAGPWVHPAEVGFFELSASWQMDSRMWDPAGELLPVADETYLSQLSGVFDRGRYDALDLTAYGEMGLGSGIEVAGSLPARYARQTWEFARGSAHPVVQPNAGLGDAYLAVRYGIQPGPAISLTVGARAPLYDNAPAELGTEPGNSDFYDDRVSLGAGVTALEPVLAIGSSLAGSRAWVQGDVGARLRNRKYSAMIPSHLQVGAASGRLTGWVGAELQLSLHDGAAPDFFTDVYGKGPLVVDGQEWASVDAGALIRASGPWKIAVGASRTVWGRSFPLVSSVRAGVAFDGPLRHSGGAP
jgi:hypothetical protein